jgi:hypothetical protein
MAKYTLNILDNQRNVITRVTNFMPLSTTDDVWLDMTRTLSSWGTCKFRVGTKDPLFRALGDILQPYQNHVQVLRDGNEFWQGVIVQNAQRTRYFVEVEARTYSWLLNKLMIVHDPDDGTGDGLDNYTTLNSGTMSNAVQTILTKALAKVQGANLNTANALSQLTLGEIDNPVFASTTVDNNGNPVSGPFTFNAIWNTVQFDYRTVYYVMASLGILGVCDFEITDQLVFNFKVFLGNNNPGLVLSYGENGQIEDYNVPFDGTNQATRLYGIAATVDGTILHDQVDAPDNGIDTYGLLEEVAAYSDLKNDAAVTVRITEDLSLIDTPEKEVQVTLKQNSAEVGSFGVGDIITIQINDNVTQINDPRRIVQIDTKVAVTGKEIIKITTNPPKPNYGAS